MGNGQSSRQGAGEGAEVDETPKIHSGVRVTSGLIEQLQGRRTATKGGVSADGHASQSTLPISVSNQEVADVVKQSQLLSRALDRSQRVGDLLLRREAAEEQQIASLADELIEREYRAPSRETPCQQEAAACLECYRQHEGSPEPCAEAVQRYAACARHASALVLQSKS